MYREYFANNGYYDPNNFINNNNKRNKRVLTEEEKLEEKIVKLEQNLDEIQQAKDQNEFLLKQFIDNSLYITDNNNLSKANNNKKPTFIIKNNTNNHDYTNDEAELLIKAYQELPNSKFDFDDCLMEINDTLFEDILDTKSNYSSNHINFLNFFFKVISLGKFMNISEENEIKQSLVNFMIYYKNKNIVDLLMDHEDLVKSISIGYSEVKYINLLDEEALIKTNFHFIYLIEYLKNLMISKIKSIVIVNSELNEIRTNLKELLELNIEKQEELRRYVILLKEMKNDYTVNSENNGNNV